MVCEGDGLLDVLYARQFTKRADQLGDFGGIHGSGQRKSLLDFHVVCSPFFGCVCENENKLGIERPPGGSSLDHKDFHRCVKIHVIQPQMDISRRQVWIEGSFDAITCRNLFVCGAQVRAQIEALGDFLRSYFRKA